VAAICTCLAYIFFGLIRHWRRHRGIRSRAAATKIHVKNLRRTCRQLPRREKVTRLSATPEKFFHHDFWAAFPRAGLELLQLFAPHMTTALNPY